MAQVNARLAQAVAVMAGPAAEATVRRVADETAAKMRTAAPVLSGELQHSIHTVDGGHAANDIVVDADHAGFVEFGTNDTPEQPYFRPPLHQAERLLPQTARTVYRSTVPYLD